MEFKKCCVCGKEFEADKKSRVTCNDTECKRIHHAEYLKAYNAERRRKRKAEVNEYNRKWMREYRAKDKDTKQTASTFDGLDYAARQKARTLELVGRIQI